MKGPLNCTSSELSTYLRALAADCLPTSCSATNASVPSKSIHIASKSYQHGKKTVSFHGFQFSVTSRNSTGDRGKDWLILSPEDSHAKTLVTQVRELESQEVRVGSGNKCLEWFARLDRNTSLWRTPQPWLIVDLEPSLETWPRWGTMRDGECFPLPMLAHRTSEREFLYWRTPCLPGNGGSNGKKKLKRMLPTPRVSRGNQNPSLGKRRNDCLTTEIIGEPILGMRPHPKFVEWMMGWPTGYSDISALETDKFQQWLRSHGIC